MTDFNQKTAVISGGAEGIGLSIAQALGAQGMNIVLGDIAQDTLAVAETTLQDAGVAVLTVAMDVTKPEDWQRLADAAQDKFGKIHMLVNNAGVASRPGPVEHTNLEDWRWVLDVNLMGVVQGAATMVPKIKQHGEGGWIVNVASMAGMAGVPFAGAYTATKVAVVGMSEAWQVELAPHNIHVSVLCPAFVQTRIHLSGRNRQAEYKTQSRANSAAKQSKDNNDSKDPTASFVENGIPVGIVGHRVVEALQAGEHYIFTHPSYQPVVDKRSANIATAFEKASASPLLQDIDDQGPIAFG